MQTYQVVQLPPGEGQQAQPGQVPQPASQQVFYQHGQQIIKVMCLLFVSQESSHTMCHFNVFIFYKIILY